ncbi:DUF4942 domain-containing protein (plasmid) [Trichlorobacter lovleyi]|uniref:DUF4942 domain-containing protein n=1 Tax=Trichlorobacter lovleyi TaxID=313985 RepID=UPI002240DE9F|nr:DUF4942 domain-containing protein [Trichlorobacter lovleyi]QOX80886.1 DUF4942 domain-containing protein [Trichlorobacter lovleyi]
MHDGSLIQRDTVAQLVGNYIDAVKDITRAYDLLHAAKNRLNTSYGLGQRIYSFDVLPHGYGRGESLRDDSLATVLKQIKLDAWRVLVERLELRKLLSIGRRSELDKQLADGKDLPEITIENVWGLFESAAANIDTYMEEAVAEVFEMLRPHRSKLKTNTEFEVGKRVVLERYVEPTYNKKGFRVRYSYDAQLTALDNVFLRLDGKGVISTYHGPCRDAIESAGADGRCETEYFRLKCCLNSNLHVEFKRLDLVEQLNRIAGGARLKTKA